MRSAHRSFDRFKKRLERSRLDAVYTKWGISNQVQAQRSLPDDEFLIDVAIWCGTDVRDATWMANASFPDFQGVSGGAVQFFFPDATRKAETLVRLLDISVSRPLRLRRVNSTSGGPQHDTRVAKKAQTGS